MPHLVTWTLLAFAAAVHLAPTVGDAALPATVVAPNTSETFDVGMLRVEHRGIQGRTPIIFVPALFCGAWQWEQQVAALSNDYDIYALTLPGFDGRPRDSGGDLMERAVSDISQLIATRHLSRPILVGHSLGGTLSVLFAERHPDEVRAVISAEGGYPIGPTAEVREQRVSKSTAPYVGVASGAAFGAVLRANMLQYVITSPVHVDSIERLAVRTDPAAMVDWMRAALLLDLTAGLHMITMPLVEIVPFDRTMDGHQGYSSVAAKRTAYERWVAHAPRGSVVMIDHSRHFVMMDQPAAFNRALYTAIKRSSSEQRQR